MLTSGKNRASRTFYYFRAYPARMQGNKVEKNRKRTVQSRSKSCFVFARLKNSHINYQIRFAETALARWRDFLQIHTVHTSTGSLMFSH